MISTPFGDRYRIVEAVASEAPIAAFRAIASDGSTVLIKVVRVRDVDGVLSRIELARAVDHPNVVRVREAAAQDGYCFVVYDDGGETSLGAFLAAQGKMPPLHVAGWGALAAAGLGAIHAAGIVHGRVRPSTLLLATDGSVKVADVGMADALGPADLTAAAPATTAGYVSPEEVLGRPLLPASDTYALGVSLYELSTGRLPIGGGDAFAVARGHAEGLVRPPRDVDPDISEDFERVILRSLSKAPEDRYVTARAMQRNLERVAAGQPVDEPRVSVSARHRTRGTLPWFLVGGLITLVATLAVLWLAGIIGASSIDVPNLTGLALGEATEKLADEGLKVGVVSYDAGDPGAEQGTVLDQSPSPGTEVDEGSAVDLVLAGTAPATVPDVVGMDQYAATTTLTQAGFTLGEVTPVPDPDVPIGLIVSQSPAAGTQAPPGTAVTITVSSGPTPGAVTPTATPVTPTPTVVTPTPTVITPTPTSSPSVILP